MEEKELQLKDYIDLIFRYKWTIFISFFAVLGATIIYNFTRPPQYRSGCTFMIEMMDMGLGGGFNSQFNMRRKIRPEGFYEAVVKSRRFKAAVAQRLSEDKVSPISSMTQAFSFVEDNLKLTTSKITDLYELEAKTHDPYLAFQLATIATDEFKNRCQQIDQEEAQNVVTFVDDQIKIARDRLETAERELQTFRERTKVDITLEGGLLKELAQLENQLTEIQTQRELAQANINAYDQRLKNLRGNVSSSLINSESAEVIQLRDEISQLETQKNEILQGAVENKTLLADLSTQLELKKKELINKVIESAEYSQSSGSGEQSLWQSFEESRVKEELNLFILKNRESYCERLIAKFKNDNPNLLENAMEMARLARTKTVSENLLNFLVQRGEEAKIEAATSSGGVRVIDPAVKPTDPIPPNTKRNILLGAILGLGLGFGLALLREFLDNTIRTSDDVTKFLNLPIMGMVPEISNGKLADNLRLNKNVPLSEDEPVVSSAKAKLISHLKLKDPVTETYRSLRTNLSFSSLDNPIKSIMVTSAGPAEGKSLTCANLAISFAETGRKTAIVDTDLRKPTQHKLFNIEKAPGLTNFMVDEVKLDDIIYPSGIDYLHLIPVGKTPPNPAEILGSQKFAELMKILLNRFDMLLFDTPPVISVTDPILISINVDGILFVVKFGTTDKQLAVSALDRLKKARTNIIGVVLNETQFHRGYGYYRYYNYYNYYYSGDGKKKKKAKVV